MEELLAALGDRVPRALLLTHVHLDHAGATGALVRHWPQLEVWAHERGAPHLHAPDKLITSARRLYGEQMDRMWGEIVPVPTANLHLLKGGETVSGFRVAYTPGHASHHVSFLHEDSGLALVGDVAGVRIPPATYTIPPTPPPDIDIEAWRKSITRVGEWRPRALALTHFGVFEDVEAQLAEVDDRLFDAAGLARRLDEENFAAFVREELADATDPDTAAAYLQAAPPDQGHRGLARYWRKRDESGS